MMTLHRAMLQTILYYDIWEHPLTIREIFAYLPVKVRSLEELANFVALEGAGPDIREHQGYFYLSTRTADVVEKRRKREELARKRWRLARLVAHVIKRFPFVRGIFVSGDLSKNVASPGSDIDFVVITQSRRLWIARTLLMLFKKLVLLNRKKFFCLNTFAAMDAMCFSDQNLYSATEVATLKPLYDDALFRYYLDANAWITGYFPNFRPPAAFPVSVDNRRSSMQRAMEFLLNLLPLERVESYLLNKMKLYWAQRYPEFDEQTRQLVFRSTPGESRAHVGNYQGGILQRYEERLKQFGLLDAEPREIEQQLLVAG